MMMDWVYHSAGSFAPAWFLAAFGCFYLAVHRQPGDHARHVLGMLSIFAVATAGYLRGQQPDRDSAEAFILVMLSVAMFLRTFTLIFWKGYFLKPTGTLFDLHRLRDGFVFWTTLITDKPEPLSVTARKTDQADQLVREPSNSSSQDDVSMRVPANRTDEAKPQSLSLFIIHTLDRLLLFWAADQATSHLVDAAILSLRPSLDDFAPHKQGLVPPPDARELWLRAILSLNWIRATSLALCAMREALALAHVAVLRAEPPSSWAARAPLYGATPAEAYTLRRFWGVFWHRLHVETLAAYAPPFARLAAAAAPARWRRLLVDDEGADAAASAAGRGSRRPGAVVVVEKMLAAGWIFFSSALTHAVSGWVLMGRSHVAEQMHFFLLNWVVCLLETLAGQVFFGKERRGAPVPAWRRVVGHVWVLGVFFALVPSWQYSIIHYSALRNAV